MSRYRDMVQQTLELSETTSQALGHIRRQLASGQFETAVIIFADVVYAVVEMMKTVQLMEAEMELQPVFEANDVLQEYVARMAGLFEKREYGAAGLVLANQLRPSYQAWQRQLYADLQPAAIS